MKEWLVCSTREGRLSIMTRLSREDMIKRCNKLRMIVDTHVVRDFDTLREADEYLDKMKMVNKLIEEL